MNSEEYEKEKREKLRQERPMAVSGVASFLASASMTPTICEYGDRVSADWRTFQTAFMTCHAAAPIVKACRSTQEQNMKAMRTLGAVPTIATVGVALLLVPSARACDDSPRGLGDHPAVVVQRLYKAAGYDYASKFYPHPAGLRLYAEPRAIR
jgi:hypothetical protein